MCNEKKELAIMEEMYVCIMCVCINIVCVSNDNNMGGFISNVNVYVCVCVCV
jgi:hypothetical protein